MMEIRFHGRGGQGAVTSCELLSSAIIYEGRYAQGFASFGPERRGAPVLAFVRSGEEAMNLREQVYTPDVVVVLDPTLLRIVDVTAGLKDGGWVVLNTRKPPDQVKSLFSGNQKLALVNATAISNDILHIPVVSVSILGAVVRATGIVDIKSLEKPIMSRFGTVLARRNNEALLQTHRNTLIA